MIPTVMSIKDVGKRLSAWGIYHRLQNEPPNGYYKIQPFARFMVRKDDWDEPFIPHDWTPEIVVDTCIQVLTMLHPITAFALITTYGEHYRVAEQRAQRMTHLMGQDDPDFRVVSIRKYWLELRRGKYYVIEWIEARAEENREEEKVRKIQIEELLQAMI